VDATQTANSLKITGANTNTLAIAEGTALNLASGGLLYTGDNELTINAPGQLGANNAELVVIANGSNTLTVAASISGGSDALTKSGSDTVQITGDNAYSGGTTLNNGTVLVNNAGGGSGLGTGSVTVNSGAMP
jgi:autotransporter-associated beta strand protein